MSEPHPRPLVGIPVCVKQIETRLFHAVGEKYVHCVRDIVDAVPLLVPALGPDFDMADLVRQFDGFLFNGSPSNIEPHRYGHERAAPDILHDPARDETTLALIPEAIKAGVPTLYLCRGHEELNVALGGTLHQLVHQKDELLDHRSPRDAPTMDDKYRISHTVRITPGGLLHRLAGGADEVEVNSLHDQAIDTLAPGLTVEAVAPDGVIEAVSVADAPAFALSLQWHPEHPIALEWPLSQAVFQAFAEAVWTRARQRHGGGFGSKADRAA
jgi:putative glutamine amidotransferase